MVSELCEKLENYNALCGESLRFYGDFVWPLQGRSDNAKRCAEIASKEAKKYRDNWKYYGSRSNSVT